MHLKIRREQLARASSQPRVRWCSAPQAVARGSWPGQVPVHRRQVLPVPPRSALDRDLNLRMYPADTVAIPPIPCQLKGLSEWMRVDLPFSLSGRQFYRLDQLRIIRIRFRAIDPLRYRPTFTPQVRPNRSTRNHCGVCGRNDDRDECLYFCSLE
jgi:hypothetical protein